MIHEDSIVLQSVFTNAREKLSTEWNDDNEEDLDVDEESRSGAPSATPSVKGDKDESIDYSEDVSLASTSSATKSSSKKKREHVSRF